MPLGFSSTGLIPAQPTSYPLPPHTTGNRERPWRPSRPPRPAMSPWRPSHAPKRIRLRRAPLDRTLAPTRTPLSLWSQLGVRLMSWSPCRRRSRGHCAPLRWGRRPAEPSSSTSSSPPTRSSPEPPHRPDEVFFKLYPAARHLRFRPH
ncbi:hypothetical protein VPH35_044664 [Triticum aestivum]